MDTIIEVSIYALITLLGILVGSFLNVLIYRIPKHEEFVKTSSHCMTCGHKLAWYDNIPLLSFIMLGGKCRYCKTKLSPQYPIVEAANGIIWLVLFLLRGISAETAFYALTSSALLALSVIDWRTYEIEDGFHIFILVLAAANYVLNVFVFKTVQWFDPLLGAIVVSIPFAIIYFISKGKAIGGGDVKLVAVCGLLLGWKNILFALGVGCVVGAVTHIIRMKVTKEGHVLAMGPYLSIGIFAAMLFGDMMINMYGNLISSIMSGAF